MPYTWIPGRPKEKYKTHGNLMTPANNTLPDITPLLSGCNRPLKMSFEDPLNILVYFHLKMRPQLNEIIASNYPPLQGEGKGGDGVAQQFSSPFVTAGRHESFILKNTVPGVTSCKFSRRSILPGSTSRPWEVLKRAASSRTSARGGWSR